ncbi:MAG: hypothetical protein HY319_24540 [Armatimonadetes bacterium]|nr:hypothetical protein [Armatimonadota bacterium]
MLRESRRGVVDILADSVVDAELRSHDHPNLFLVGGMVFPTADTATPTLTVAALALRTVPTLLKTFVT